MAVPSDLIMRGTLASRPAASVAGRLYYDTTNSILYRDNGSGWDSVEGSGGFSNPMTTAGDIIKGGASGAAARLAIGSSGDVLTVSGGAPVWAAPSSGAPAGVGCRVKRASGNVTAANGGSGTAIPFTAEDFDTDAFHDNSTNNTRLTVPSGKGGYYIFGGGFYADVNCDINVLLNGTTAIAFGRAGAGDSSIVAYTISGAWSFSVGDYIEIIATGRSATKTVYYDAANASPHFWMLRVGA